MRSLLNILKNILQRLDIISDFVVERGTYNESSTVTWTWEKWNSGKMVGERMTGSVTFNCTSAYGAMYYHQYGIDVPSEVPFVSIDHAEVEIIGGNGLHYIKVTGISGRNIKYYACTPSNASASNKLFTRVYGKWK